MGTTPVKLNNATDTWVHEKAPTTARGTTGSFLYASNIAGIRSQAYLYFTLPFPRGVTVISAKLRMVQSGALSGSITSRAYRATAAWSATKMTWNTRVGGTAPVSLTKSSPADGTVWEWDVTAQLQSVSTGSPWYGFVVDSTITSGNSLRFHSPQSATLAYRPVLEVSWKENPQKPTEMYPSNGRAVSTGKPVLRTNFLDLSGDTTMQAIQVRIFDTQANAIANASAAFDSGTVASDTPELDLNTTAYAGAAADSIKYWRVRVQDGSGLWSDWSEYTSFTVKTKGVLTITNPPSTTISDATPPVDWTFTGRTQKAYQVVISAINGAYRRVTYDSGKVTSTSTFATVPDSALRFNNYTYLFIIRVWDTIDRETIAGDPAYVEQQVTVTYTYDATVTAATSLAVSMDPVYPWATLTWSRAVMPDNWTIYRDGKVIKTALGVELFVSGSNYTYVDRLADPRVQHTWMVVAVVNGKGAASSPTVNGTVAALSVTLSRPDGSNPVAILNYSNDMTLDEQAGLFSPAGSAPPVMITQSEHGYQGHISGRLAEVPGVAVTPQQWRDRFNNLKKNNGITLLLTVIDSSFECFIANATIKPFMPSPGVVNYLVEFDFYQTDWEEVP